jgi:hypothetical protein
MIMENKDRRVKVVNRTGGSLAYKIDTLRVTRHWPKPGDYLNISISELSELKTVPGGNYILKECLIIEDKEALNVLFPDIELEPEYNYGLKEVEALLYEADLAQLLDALDFAPKGVLELIKTKAIEKLPNETAKIEAINKKFKIDLNKVNELHQEKEIKEQAPKQTRRRRTAPIIETKESSLPKYKVVKEDE